MDTLTAGVRFVKCVARAKMELEQCREGFGTYALSLAMTLRMINVLPELNATTIIPDSQEGAIR